MVLSAGSNCSIKYFKDSKSHITLEPSLHNLSSAISQSIRELWEEEHVQQERLAMLQAAT